VISSLYLIYLFIYLFVHFCNIFIDTRSKSDLQRPNSKCQNCAQVPVISTAFVFNSGTSLEPFLSQDISRMIKTTADPSVSQSVSTPATSKSASDIYCTAATKLIGHCSGHLHHNNKHKRESFFCCRIKYCECQKARFILRFQSFSIFITMIFVLHSFFTHFLISTSSCLTYFLHYL